MATIGLAEELTHKVFRQRFVSQIYISHKFSDFQSPQLLLSFYFL